VGARATSDELGFYTAHKPGTLTRYFAERWLKRPSAKGEQLIAWLLEAALGRNSMYFIEKTKEYVDEWKGSGEIVPVDAFDGFAITGDPAEDTIIPHAVLVWTCMNDRPWEEEVYHRWLDELLAAGSGEAAYLAASLWPAHDLMGKVTYRPPGWLVYRGQLDAEMERLILMEMLKRYDEPRTSLYGSFEYDDVKYPWQLSELYIKRHGFTHPICGLVRPVEFEADHGLKNRIQEALDAPSWSEGVKGAAMLLYLSLNAFNDLAGPTLRLLNTLEQNLFKLDEKYINIVNFHMDKIEKIDYNLIKDYINYLIILYNKIIDKSSLSMKVFSKYMSIGLKTKDILYIDRDFKNIIFKLILEEKEKVESWLENQLDDLRIKDILLAIYMSKSIGHYYVYLNKELQADHVDKKMECIYNKIKFVDKIKLFIDQSRTYFDIEVDSYKMCDFIYYILKREKKVNFNCDFSKDYAKIINSFYLNWRYVLKEHMFLGSNHIGLYLYYNILNEWRNIIVDFRDHIKEEKELDLYLKTRDKIIENLYIHTIDNIEIKMNLYLNKIENNNLPHEEIIMDLVNEIENDYYKILEYFKDERKMMKFKELILPIIYSLHGKLRNSRLTDLLGINTKSQNIIIY
jgi:hypothetical protein